MIAESDVMQNLRVVRGYVWATLGPAIDHAIAMAKDCEYVADQAAIAAQTYVSPAYPPLVRLLADAAPRDTEGGAL